VEVEQQPDLVQESQEIEQEVAPRGQDEAPTEESAQD
jgi:hypothetical protein